MTTNKKNWNQIKKLEKEAYERGRNEAKLEAKVNCMNCRFLHNGSIIKLDVNGLCLFCGRKVGSSVDNSNTDTNS